MRTEITWHLREPPLVASAVAAEGMAARAMATRLLARSDDALARLRGVVAGDVIVVLGAAETLPWANGARYLGRDLLAPSLWMPTTRAPSVSAALLERALVQIPGRGPLAVLLSPPRLVPLESARALARENLQAVLAGTA